MELPTRARALVACMARPCGVEVLATLELQGSKGMSWHIMTFPSLGSELAHCPYLFDQFWPLCLPAASIFFGPHILCQARCLSIVLAWLCPSSCACTCGRTGRWRSGWGAVVSRGCSLKMWEALNKAAVCFPRIYINTVITGWWFGTFSIFPYTVLGMSSSHLTFIFFREVGFNHP